MGKSQRVKINRQVSSLSTAAGKHGRSQPPTLFLCHSSKDKPFVRRLAKDLLILGISAWFDEWQLSPGESLHDRIGEALEKSAFVVVILSPNSVASRWCRKELRQALCREDRSERSIVIPIRYRRVAVPAFLEDKLYVDFSRSYYVALTRLAATTCGLDLRPVSEALARTRPSNLRQVSTILGNAGYDKVVTVSAPLYRKFSELFKVLRVRLPSDFFHVGCRRLGDVMIADSCYSQFTRPIKQK